jgi:serine/threonine protein kinase
MRGDQLESVERLLQEAQQLPASGRTAFLAGIGDPEIRKEIESLLGADADRDSGIGSVISEAAVLTGELAGRLIGHFRIIRPLGHGAMGEVYVAEDAKLGRSVALKMLPLEVPARHRTSSLVRARSSGGGRIESSEYRYRARNRRVGRTDFHCQ